MREMKDSGVEWIGEIPKDWKLERLQWHLDEIVEKNDPIVTTQVLSLTNKKGVIPYEEKGAQGNVAKESYDGYKIAYPNTIVANSMNILIGSVGYSNYYGCVSPVYYVFKEKDNNDLRFINYIMQTSQFQKELRRYANGILEIRLRVSSGNILKRFCAFPDYQEQSRIADYLDSKCSKIDLVVEKQLEVIEKLVQYKQSIVFEAISKSSNIPSIRLKTIISKVQSGLSAVSGADNGVESGKYVLRTSVVSSGEYKKDEIKPVMTNCTDRLVCPIEDDILVVSRMNTAKMVGYAAYIEKAEPNYYLPDKLWKVIVDKNKACTKYLWYAINSPVIHNQYASIATGTSDSMINISISDFTNARISLPSIQKQKEIVKILDEKTRLIERQIELKNQIIEKLVSYKKSLIYEVVTGKKEV